MKIVRSVDKLRHRALQVIDELEATAAIVAPPTQKQRDALREDRANIPTASKRELHEFIAGLEARITELRRASKLRAPTRQLVTLFRKLEAVSPGQCAVL